MKCKTLCGRRSSTYPAVSKRFKIFDLAELGSWSINASCSCARRDATQLFYIDDIQIGEDRGTLELRDSHAWARARARTGMEVAAALHNEIRHIPPLLRNVFLLREVQRLPYR